MKESMRVAIMAAVNAYMVEEAKEVPPIAIPISMPSPWKVFGLQKLMRKRTSIQRRVRRWGKEIYESSQRRGAQKPG